MILKDFVERNIEKAKGCTFFGVPVEKLTREELIACVIAGQKAEKAAIKEGSRRREVLLSLRG